MHNSSPRIRLRIKLGEAIRDLVLRDEPETTARVVGTFLELLRDAPPFASADASRMRHNILSLVDPTPTERAVSHMTGALRLRALRLTREDKNTLRVSLWELYNHLERSDER